MRRYIGHSWIWVVLLLLILGVGEAAAQTWWNDSWQYRKKIRINTTATGADIKENLTDVPLLIRLHSGNFNFTDAQAEGNDIRFVSSDGTKLLKHHIESIDIIDEMALIWVRLPRLSAQSDQDFIWMYFGNKDAVGGQDARATYDASQSAVFHLDEIEGLPKDLSSYNQTVKAFSGGQGLPSVIGKGITLNGAGDQLRIAASSTLKFDKGFTFSSWVRINQAQQDAYLFQVSAENGEFVVGVDGTKVYGRVRTTGGNVFETDRSADLSMGKWHHVMVTVAPDQRLTLYMDGLPMFYTAVEGGFPEFTGDYVVGAAVDTGHGFLGDLDEVQLATSVRPEAWARTAFASQGPDGLLYSFGETEAGGGGGLPVFYLGTILKNISLDGWLIIGLLLLLMAVSWIVFLSKSFFLWTAEKENQAFAASFKEMSNPVAAFDPENGFENSNLYRVYASGCRSVREEQENGLAAYPDKILQAFKTTLEEGFINESKRLNSNLVVLTMAISGGPFLGLLGTVWGVMNTFAAMAEAGEANIMAIAPGVASALSTTVAGLVVAIPALFAYNFLAARIKTMTADLTVFIDQLTLKVDRSQGGAA